ncbi:MAG TPA: glycosyltransferase family 39 protein [Cytophagaceae bacterium]|nr:glycosyltransferase family 39 protein [Cytophagaceae bacterium]
MNRNHLFIFFVFLLLFIFVFSCLTFDGFFFYDDMMYMQYAYDVAHGNYHVTDQLHSNRFGVFLPIAILYYFFGVNDFSTLAWPFISVLFTIVILFFVFRKEDPEAGVFAILLTGLDFYTLFFSNKLYPDDIVTPFSLAGIAFLYKYRSSEKLIYPFIFVFFSITGFLVKATIIYAFAFFLLVLCIDLFKKRNLKFWMVSVISGLIICIFFFVLYKVNTGNYFFYLDSIETGLNQTPWSYYGKPLSVVIQRITIEPLAMIAASGFLIPVIISLPLSYRGRWKELFDFDQRGSFWFVCGMLMLFMFWFSSISLKYYSPIPAYPRMLLLCIPVFSVAAAFNLKRCIRERNYNLIFGALFILTALFSYFFIDKKISLIYFALGSFFIVFYFGWKYSTPLRFLFFFFPLLCILLIHPVVSILNPRSKTFHGEREIISRNLSSSINEKALVITDYRLSQSYVYYNKFVPLNNYQYVGYPRVRGGEFNDFRGKIYVLVSHDPEEYVTLYSNNIKIPDFIFSAPKTWKLIDCENKVCLYEVPDISDVTKYF